MTGGVLDASSLSAANYTAGGISTVNIAFGSSTDAGKPVMNLTSQWKMEGRSTSPLYSESVLSGYGSVSADDILNLGVYNNNGKDIFEVRGGNLDLYFAGGAKLGPHAVDTNPDAYTIRYVIDDTGVSTLRCGGDVKFGRVPPGANQSVFDLGLDASYVHTPGQVFTILSTTGVFANYAQFRNMGDGKRFSADGYRFEAAYNTGATPKTFTVTAIDDDILYATDFEDFNLGEIDGQETFSVPASNFAIGTTTNSGEYVGGLAVTTTSHNVWLTLNSDCLPDMSAASISVSVDIQPNTTAGGGVFLSGLRGSNYGPQFGLYGSGELVLREVDSGSEISGSSNAAGRSDHWLRFTFTYGFGSDRGSLTLYDLTTSESIDTGLTNVYLGNWDLEETITPLVYVRAFNGDGAAGGFQFDNLSYSLIPPRGTLIMVN